MNYWLIKQEPAEYSFDDLIAEGATDWTGVRNFQARNNIRAMRVSDKVLFYHSTSDKAVIGVAEVSRESFQDITDETGKWIAVQIKPVEKFQKAVTLEEIKTDENLQNIALIKQSRLSVMSLTRAEFSTITNLGKIKQPQSAEGKTGEH